MRRFTGEGDEPDRLDAILSRPSTSSRGPGSRDRQNYSYVDGLDEDRLRGTIQITGGVSSPEQSSRISASLRTGSIIRPITARSMTS